MKSNPIPLRRRHLVSFFFLFVGVLAFGVLSAHAQNKWHPGHYMRAFVEKVGSSILDDDDPTHTGTLQFVLTKPALKGVTVPFYWRVLEPTQGNYDFQRIRDMLAILAPGGKRLIVDVWDHGFTANPWPSMDTAVLPAYLATLSGGGGGWAPMNKGGCAKIWLAPVMNRYIALMQALAAEFDGHPYFEMICAGESARGLVDAAAAGYTADAFVTQWADNWAPAMRTAWTSSNIFFGVNFIREGNVGHFEDLIGECLTHKIFVGGPDAFVNTDSSTPGTKVVNGVNGTLGDLRGLIGLRYDQQVVANKSPGPPTPDTPALVYDNAVVRNVTDLKALRANYMSWAPHQTDPAMDWEDDVLPFLAANPNTINTLPASYAAGPFTYQGEWPILGAQTAGIAATQATDGAASGGKYLRFDSSADGHFVTLTVEVPKTQVYTIAVRYQKWIYQAKVQLSIDGTNQGALQNLYAASKTYQTITLGTKSLSTGNHSFKFTVNGKDALSTDREIRIDSIILTP